MSKDKEVAVGDTSVLLNLAFIERLNILANQFETVFVPEQVWNEVLDGEKGKEDLEAFKDQAF